MNLILILQSIECRKFMKVCSKCKELKLISDFSKEHDKLVLKAGIVDGKIATVDDLKQYASIPSRDGLLTMLAAGMMGTIRDLSICLDLYSKEK